MSRSNPDFTSFIEFDVLDNEIQFTYERFSDFVFASTEMIVKGNNDINKKIEEWNVRFPSHEFSGFDIEENNFLKLLSFEHHIDSAIMISAYSTFEANFSKICVVAAKSHHIKILPKDIAGKGIDQFKKYLVKVFEVDFSDLSSEWKAITMWRFIRNKIVHENGVISASMDLNLEKMDEVKYIKSNFFADISAQGQILLSSVNIHKFLTQSEEFLHSLIKKVIDKKGTL